MATIINNPNDGTAPREGGAGAALGIVIALLIILLILFFGIPYFRGGANEAADQNGASLDVNLNTGSNGETGGGQ